MTRDEARNLLRRAVETQGPDFIYRPRGFSGKCTYTVADFVKQYQLDQSLLKCHVDADDPRLKTGCLIGVALDLAGFTAHHRSSAGIRSLAILEEFARMDPWIFDYFGVAQDAQDNGRTWGQVYQEAEDWAQDVALGIIESW